MKKTVIFMLMFVLSGCAYMVNGDTQTIKLATSDNKHVKVRVKDADTETIYTLPTQITVKKSEQDIIVTTIATECIIPTQTIISSSVDEWTYANIANLGVGLIKDMQGSAWKYNDVYVIKVNRDSVCINKAKKLNDYMLNLHM